jgi:cyclic-di-GMP-binding protein
MNAASEITTPFLASPERVSAWLDSLPQNDLNAARAQVANVLPRLAQSREPLTVDGVTMLARLEQGCAGILTDVLRLYLKDTQSKSASEVMRHDMNTIFAALGEAYTRFVVTYHETRTSVRQVAPLMALVITRGLYALGNQAKWAFFTQDSPPADCWRQMHVLYEYAEKDGIDTMSVNLFERPYEVASSCGGMYIRSMLLSTLNNGSFSAREVETADNWLVNWTANHAPNRLFMEEEHFYATMLHSAELPFRIRGPLNDPNARYIKTARLMIEIERAKTRIEEGHAQHDMGFVAVQPLADSAGLLDRLVHLWAPASVMSEQRKNRRVKVEDEAVSAVRGLNGICESARQDYERANGPMDVNRQLTREEEMDLQVYGFITERTRSRLRSKPLDATQPIAALEGWTLVDESVEGYGIAFPAGTYRELKLGMLVGIKRRKAERWFVGSVVRVRTNRASNQTFAGVDLISLSPVIVTLGEDIPDAPVKTTQLVWGLFLPGNKTPENPDTLLVDSALFQPRRQLVMGARNVRYSVRVGKSVRSGEGWHRITFQVLGKRT